jgi:hypothetical protein
MKFVHTKLDGTFVVGVSFSNFVASGKRNISLIFDLGSHSFAFILKGEY